MVSFPNQIAFAMRGFIPFVFHNNNYRICALSEIGLAEPNERNPETPSGSESWSSFLVLLNLLLNLLLPPRPGTKHLLCHSRHAVSVDNAQQSGKVTP